MFQSSGPQGNAASPSSLQIRSKKEEMCLLFLDVGAISYSKNVLATFGLKRYDTTAILGPGIHPVAMWYSFSGDIKT